MRLSNPLRYPGSKSKLSAYIENFILDNDLQKFTIYEPYAGSASISLSLLQKNLVKKAVLIELDPLIYSFWYSVFNHTDELIEKIINIPVNIDTWTNLSKYKDGEILNKAKIVDVGLAGLFFNRTSFSGILKAGPLGGTKQKSAYKIDCRFNKQKIINDIINISAFKSKVQIINDDAINYLRNNKVKINRNKSFLYIDPPYYEKGPSLYRYWYSHNDHKELSNFTSSIKKPWLISYDNNDEIKSLYKTTNLGIQEIYFDYSIAGKKIGNELLISNCKIPPFSQYKFSDILA